MLILQREMILVLCLLYLLSSHVKFCVRMDTWAFIALCMLVGLQNANIIMSHKLTEKRQSNHEIKEADDRCTHGTEPEMLWEEHQGRKQRRRGGEQRWGKAESPLGSILLGTQQIQNPTVEGCC